MSKDYCWRFGEHKGEPCPCGYPDKKDVEYACLLRVVEAIKECPTTKHGAVKAIIYTTQLRDALDAARRAQ